MKNILFAALFLIAATAAVRAQSADTKEGLSGSDTAYKKVLLIPYDPMMHLSDTDHDIAEFSEKSPAEIRAAFRYGLTSYVYSEMIKTYPTVLLESNTLRDNERELNIIYGSINYRMDTIFPVAHPPATDLHQKWKSVFSKRKEIHDLKFMNVTLSHPALLNMLADEYGTDLFVFLNQFEIITNYDDCLDLAMKIYRRQLKVHYSVYDVNGKEVYGDVAVVDFPSNSNDVDDIIRKNFPKIAEYIVKSIPKKQEAQPQIFTEVKKQK